MNNLSLHDILNIINNSPIKKDCTITTTLKEDCEGTKWNEKHPVDDNLIPIVFKKDSKVRITMISRLGDIGITDELDKQFGYHARIEVSKVKNITIKIGNL
jgi:hypothetical protein